MESTKSSKVDKKVRLNFTQKFMLFYNFSIKSDNVIKHCDNQYKESDTFKTICISITARGINKRKITGCTCSYNWNRLWDELKKEKGSAMKMMIIVLNWANSLQIYWDLLK